MEPQIKALWPRFNTYEIAQRLKLHESIVYNVLAGMSYGSAVLKLKAAQPTIKRIKFGTLALAIVAGASSGKTQEAFPTRQWTQEQREQIYRFYEPISGLTRSSHWHDYDCCQTYRCFPARPGSVRWTPDGIAITHPDGDVHLYAEDDPIWKQKKAEGVNDPRAHICFEVENGEWITLCGYKAGIHG